MKRSHILIIAILVSIFIHLVLLFLIHHKMVQPVEFAIQQGDGTTEVNLVGSASEKESSPPGIQPPSEKRKEPPPPSKPEDVTQPQMKKNKPLLPSHVPSTEKDKSSSTSGEGSPTEGSGSSHPGSSGGSTSAKPDYLKNPPPEYPEDARDNHQEGVVILSVEVSEGGTALNVTLQKSSGFKKLDDSAIKAVKGWKFKAATKDGTPIQSKVEVPVRFRLSE